MPQLSSFDALVDCALSGSLNVSLEISLDSSKSRSAQDLYAGPSNPQGHHSSRLQGGESPRLLMDMSDAFFTQPLQRDLPLQRLFGGGPSSLAHDSGKAAQDFDKITHDFDYTYGSLAGFDSFAELSDIEAGGAGGMHSLPPRGHMKFE